MFLERLSAQLDANNIQLHPRWDIDHLCYRVETQSSYETLKTVFQRFGRLLIESEVNGRPIATYKLDEPVRWNDRLIDVVELPAPKPSKPTKEGFEHIEIVCDRPFGVIKELYPQSRFDDGGLKKSFNQELEIELDGLAIKFHHLSLESVVNLESNEKVMGAIQRSGVLEKLRTYRPLIAGTFPLDLSTAESDVDVIVSGDTDELLGIFDQHFSSLPEYESYIARNDGEDYALARFRYDGVPFELYGQTTDSVLQRSYRHFQIEERLLKLGGADFRKKVASLRAEGLKTEPAFAKALGLGGDPYLALLELHGKSSRDLLSIIEASRR